MSTHVFWSWESDRPGKVNRHFLKDVLDRAIEHIGNTMEVDERPELDHDTKGEAGMVSIPDAILEKIDRASVFVADITPVAVTDEGKWVANPNVLIELGYAKKALGPKQIITIWNSAWGGCSPEDLPFDLRHRRAPFSYHLAPEASRTEISKIADALTVPLAEAIHVCLRNRPSPDAKIIRGIEPRTSDPSVWFERESSQIVNAGTSYGADTVTFVEAPRGFLRVIPNGWPSDRRPTGNRSGLLDFYPLGDFSGLCWGRTRGGVIVYHIEDRQKQNVTVCTATQWFSATGEIWGFDSRVMFNDSSGHRTIANVYLIECWDRFLSKAEEFYKHYGVSGPFQIIGGVTELDGARWPAAGIFSSTVLGVEEDAIVSVLTNSLDSKERRRILELLDGAVRDAFGLSSDPEQLDKILATSERKS